MSERKIVEWQVISAPSLEDYGADGAEKGLNALGKVLIDKGYLPNGDLKYHTSVYHGQNNFVTTSFHYTKEFVKYES